MKAKIDDLLKSGVAFIKESDYKSFIYELAQNGIKVCPVQYWNGGVTVRLASVKR